MKRTIPLLAAAMASCAPQAAETISPDSLASAAATITAADVHERIAFLADDALLGRDTPSPGLDSAAAWIASELDRLGLEPAGEEGFYQWYPYPAEALDPVRTELAAAAGATHAFQYGVDFFAWRGAPVADAVGIVYAGSELAAANGQLRDRAVLLSLDARPLSGRDGYRFDLRTRRQLESVRERARRAGAAAVVFLLSPTFMPGEVERMARAGERPQRVLGGVADSARALPTFFLTPSAAERMFRMADLAVPRPDRVEDGPLPLPGLTLRLAAPSQAVDQARAPNVAGVIRGSDPELRDRYVVLSAHMDHVGVGPPDQSGDSIYNGADDDASGTSLLLEVAEAMAGTPAPRRSVLFLAVSGEEKGLLGSHWFTDHPTVPTDAMIANLNLDMVGRNAPDSIVVIGQEYSTLGQTLHEVASRHAEQLGLTVVEDPWPEERFFLRSDHFNFARHEVPPLFFFAGTHEDYHRPGDELDRVDTDKVARVGRLVFFLTRALADGADAPQWTPEGLRTVRRLTGR